MRTKFLSAVKRQLKSKVLDPLFTMEFGHDIFRYIFKDKGSPCNVPASVMLYKEDFERMRLPASWHYTLDKDGEGHSVEFPIRAKSILKRSRKEYIVNTSGVLVQGPVYLFEMVQFYMTKNPCSKESLI